MKILLTGATGYIGKRLLPVLIAKGHQVACCVRDKNRFNPPDFLREKIDVIEVDFLDETSLKNIPKNIDAAYYLVHSMSSSMDYGKLEKVSAINFRESINNTRAQQVIYLSGIVNEHTLSRHLASRKAVEKELSSGHYHLTTLRAGIIIGSGSASFEIIRDLVEKLPVMIAPKWLKTKCQPVAIRDVITLLSGTLFNEATYDQSFDIGGPEIITYEQMLLGYAKVRHLKRWIFIVPVMTPKLSSYWLYFITATSFKLAAALVDSMKIEVVCRDNKLNELLNFTPVGYQEALTRTFSAIGSKQIISSWKDSLISGTFNKNLSEYIDVPSFGCLKDRRHRAVSDNQKTTNKIWSIGGETGWYFANSLWKIRGFLDKLFGGVGLRRGRTNPRQISAGDAIDFWRVLYANKNKGHLLLFAEMKLPGEAWLEFKFNKNILYQTATFRPRGLWGRIYWYTVFPFHSLIFAGLINRLAK
jgi:uncharacterized protein YbjT (DUF2867 family)